MTLKSREKLLIIFAVVAVVFWAFVTFYFNPQVHKIKALNAELKEVDLKSDESLLAAKGVETLEAEILRQEEALKRLNERILKGDEFKTFLRHLAKESDSSQMKVVSLIPQEENLPPSEGKKEGFASQYRRITVQMVLYSSYYKLGSYLKGVEELPFLINVDNIQIERIEEARPLLKVSMRVSMYITSS